MFSPLPAIVYVPFAASNSTLPLCSTFPTSPELSKIPTAPPSAAFTEIPGVHFLPATANTNPTKHTTTQIFLRPLSMQFLLDISANLGRPARLVNAMRGIQFVLGFALLKT
jgi:hypothetical protein